MAILSIEQELKETELAIEHCRSHAERQRAEVERRERVGHDASQARRLMMTFRQVQTEHEAHRDRLRAELAQPGERRG
jgi:hypothetical protein